MKATTSTIFMSLLLLPLLSIAQLQVDAGSNGHYCPDLTSGKVDTTYLGGNPSAAGGVPPYTYTWYTSSSTNIKASSFVNDTTLPNPFMTTFSDVTLILKVEDNNGNIGYDSCILTTSLFAQHIGNYNVSITQGDSLLCPISPNVSSVSQYQDSTVIWYPSHGLSDTTLFTEFWVKPDSSITYAAKVTDAAGCQVKGVPFFNVSVVPLGIKQTNKKIIDLQLFPNPVKNRLTINTESTIEAVRISTISGQLLVEDKSGSKTINVSELTAGSYVLQALQNGLWQTTTFVKE